MRVRAALNAFSRVGWPITQPKIVTWWPVTVTVAANRKFAPSASPEPVLMPTIPS